MFHVVVHPPFIFADVDRTMAGPSALPAISKASRRSVPSRNVPAKKEPRSVRQAASMAGRSIFHLFLILYHKMRQYPFIFAPEKHKYT